MDSNSLAVQSTESMNHLPNRNSWKVIFTFSLCVDDLANSELKRKRKKRSKWCKLQKRPFHVITAKTATQHTLILNMPGFPIKHLQKTFNQTVTWALFLDFSRLLIGRHVWSSWCHGNTVTAGRETDDEFDDYKVFHKFHEQDQNQAGCYKSVEKKIEKKINVCIYLNLLLPSYLADMAAT